MQSIQNALGELYRSASAVDADAYELAAKERICELMLSVDSVVRRGLDLCLQIGDDAGDDIAAVAFVARLALKRQLRLLDDVANVEDTESVIATCGAGLREAIRMAAAIDTEIVKQHGHARVTPDMTEHLQRALALRAAYRRLQYTIEPELDVTPLSLGHRVDTALRAIVHLLGEPIAQHIRMRDRAALRLAADKLAMHADIPAWRDAAHVVESLQQINLRAELCAHDITVCNHAIKAIDAGEPVWPEALFGRSPAVDALLALPTASPADWRAALLDMRAALSPDEI